MQHKPLVLVLSDTPSIIHALNTMLDTEYTLIIGETYSKAISLYTEKLLHLEVVLIEANAFGKSSHVLHQDLHKISTIPQLIYILPDRSPQHLSETDPLDMHHRVHLPLLIETVHHKIRLAQKHYSYFQNLQEAIHASASFDHHSRLLLYQEKLLKHRSEGTIIPLDDCDDYFMMPEYSLESPMHDLQHAVKEDLLGMLPKPMQQSILIADPKIDSGLLLQSAICLHHQTCVTPSLNETLRYCESQAPVDIAFLDASFGMPALKQIIASLKQNDPLAEIILTIPFDQRTIIPDALSLGISDYLFKPFHKNDLLLTLSLCLERKHYPFLFPKLISKLRREGFSDEKRLQMFKTLCEKRKKNNHKIRMMDIYTFFPESKKIGIPHMTTFSPNSLLKLGIKRFVQKLSNSATQQSFM